MRSAITVWPRKAVFGWDKNAAPTTREDAPAPMFPVLDVRDALGRAYDTDAHFVPYRINGFSRCPRINKGGLAELERTDHAIAYDLLPIDVDAPKDAVAREPVEGEDDPKKWPARGSWVALELNKLKASPLWASAGWYRTRGGFRLLWELPAMAREVYTATCANLHGYLVSLGLAPDRLLDFGRCFRLPDVVRSGVRGDWPSDFSRLGMLPTVPGFAVDEDLADAFAGVGAARIGRFELPTTIADGQRDNVLTSYAGQLRHKGHEPAAILSALVLANSARCAPPLELHDLQRIARSIGAKPTDSVEAMLKGLVTIAIRAGAESQIVDEAIRSIANAWPRDDGNEGGAIFDRSGELVTVYADHSTGEARIGVVDLDALRGQLGTLARWIRVKAVGDGFEERPADVPMPIVKGLVGRKTRPGIRHLEGIVETPTLRPDGSILETLGHDTKTGLFFAASRGVVWPKQAESPTRADAVAALEALEEIVVDYPFRTTAHKSVAISAMLTPIARPAIRGSVPLFLFSGSDAGSGKSLLAKVVGILATGHAPAATVQQRDEEMAKAILPLLESGQRVVLIDNVPKPLGGQALDALITTGTWSGRVLGVSKMATHKNLATWIATGNNLTIKGDLARRCLSVYIAPMVERPEERDGFRHPDLTGWVTRERVRLVTAALTLLRAYVVAGRPPQGLKAFGSFEGWSGLVRSALVWAGAADPCDTRAEIRDDSDTTGDAMAQIFEACFELFGSAPTNTRTIVNRAESQAYGGNGDDEDPTIANLAEALGLVAGDRNGTINPRRVGQALAKVKGAVRGGFRLTRGSRSKGKGVEWIFEPFTADAK